MGSMSFGLSRNVHVAPVGRRGLLARGADLKEPGHPHEAYYNDYYTASKPLVGSE